MDTTRARYYVGKSSKIMFSQPIATRAGSPVRIYDIFESRYINGAYYERETDIWYPLQWDWNGQYATHPSSSDLVNEKPTFEVPEELDVA